MESKDREVCFLISIFPKKRKLKVRYKHKKILERIPNALQYQQKKTTILQFNNQTTLPL